MPSEHDSPKRYGDTWTKEPVSLQELAELRVTYPSPLLADSTCPAGQYTFSVSDHQGSSPRNPTEEERLELLRAIRDTGRCCQHRSDQDCWARQQV